MMSSSQKNFPRPRRQVQIYLKGFIQQKRRDVREATGSLAWSQNSRQLDSFQQTELFTSMNPNSAVLHGKTSVSPRASDSYRLHRGNLLPFKAVAIKIIYKDNQPTQDQRQHDKTSLGDTLIVHRNALK